jgi:hypothetical protein
MSKRFNIHEWQAKQRRLEETFEGNAFGKAMQGAEKGDTVKVGDQEFTKKEHHNIKNFPKLTKDALTILDFLKSYNTDSYNAVEKYLMDIKEASVTGGGGVAVNIDNGGSPAGPFPTKKAFKNTKKED